MPFLPVAVRRACWLVLSLPWCWPASAALTFSATAANSLDRSQPLSFGGAPATGESTTWGGYCLQGGCVAQVLAGSADSGLSARHFQADDADGMLSTALRGLVTVSGPAEAGTVAVTMNLRFVGSMSLTGVVGLTHGAASVVASVSVGGAGAEWALTREMLPGDHHQLVTAQYHPPGTSSVAATLSPLGVLTATLQLPVNQPFELKLGLDVLGAGSFLDRIDLAYSLGFFPGQTFFDLPAGYSASSADWSVVDNRWCGMGACAVSAVPEPGAGALAAAGLLLTMQALRRRRRAAGAGAQAAAASSNAA